MNNLRNSVNLIGNLGMDPEIRELENGKKLARFSIATHGFYKDSEGNKKKETAWHHVVAWDGNATIAEKYLRKGREVAIQGRLSHRSYEDKSGQQKYFTEIVANEILLLGSAEQA